MNNARVSICLQPRKMNVRYLIVNMTAYQTNIYHPPEKVAKDSEHMEILKEGESDKIK